MARLTNLVDYLFTELDKYLQEKCDYEIHVVGRADNTKYPKVVFGWELRNTNNYGVSNRNIENTYTFTLDIYAKDIGNVDSIRIAEHIQSLIYDLYVVKMGIQCTFARPTPNIDESVYRISMKFDFSAMYK